MGLKIYEQKSEKKKEWAFDHALDNNGNYTVMAVDIDSGVPICKIVTIGPEGFYTHPNVRYDLEIKGYSTDDLSFNDDGGICRL